MLFTHFHQISRKHVGSFIYPFLPNVPFLYPLKKSEKFGYLTFSWRIEMDHWVKCANTICTRYFHNLLYVFQLLQVQLFSRKNRNCLQSLRKKEVINSATVIAYK